MRNIVVKATRLAVAFWVCALIAEAPTDAEIIGFYNCHSVCSFSYQTDPVLGYKAFDQDFTIPTDGRTHVWTYKFHSADANATLVLDPVDQVDRYRYYRDGNGGLKFRYDERYNFYDDELIQPGLLRYTVFAEKSFNFCTLRGGHLGQLCEQTGNVWGNGTFLRVNSFAPVSGVFTENVPEPNAWAMLVSGFGLTGVVLRRRVARTGRAV